MINTDDLKYAQVPNIVVEPSNDLFRELGNNTYDFLDLISEFIDNSIAASFEDRVLNVEIEIGLSEDARDQSYFLIRDNGQGIPREKLGKALSPGALSGGTSLNEHGLGMKQAIAALGSLKYLATKANGEKEAIIIDELKYGEIFPKLYTVDWAHGTEICIDKLRAIVPRNSQVYTKSISRFLGARYRRFLKMESPKLALTIKLLDLDDIDQNDQPVVTNKWPISEIKPVYFHPNKRRNEPVILRKEFKGIGWEAEFTFGYAPKDEEYQEMGLEPPKNYEPYHVSLSKQGFDIIKNDRIVNFHQLSQIGIVTMQHNKYNYVRGEIDLKKGFVTAITKNHIIFDSNFEELKDQVKEFLEEKKYLEKITYPDELPEKLIRDRLAAHLKTRTIEPKKDVKTEYAIEGLGGFIDILADGEAWEIKINPSDGLDVYQLFAYMDMGNVKKGYLVSSAFKTGAKSARDFIEREHDKVILLVKADEFPIMHAPSTEEIKKYF